MEVGNFDRRDPEDEIMFMGRRAEHGDLWVLTMMDGKSGDYAWYRGFSRYLADVGDAWINTQLRKIDVDGDRVYEVFADLNIFGDFHTLPLPPDTGPANASGPNLRVIYVGLEGKPPGDGIFLKVPRVHAASVGNVAQLNPIPAGQTRAPFEEELVAVEFWERFYYGGLVQGRGDAQTHVRSEDDRVPRAVTRSG